MQAVTMWARADLRQRWRSWVALGLLAGVSVGLAAAAIAGARRAERTIPTYVRAVNMPDAGVLANDPHFDDAARATVNRLPEVRAAFPFMVPFSLGVASPAGMDLNSLLPAAPQSMSVLSGVVLSGRMPDAHQPDEIVVNEFVRKAYRIGVGGTVTIAQDQPHIEQVMHVVGVLKDPDPEASMMPSSAFYEKYRDKLSDGFVNEFVNLRHGTADLHTFRTDVQRVLGRPVNVTSMAEMNGVPKLEHITGIERTGLLLFAFVVIVGAVVLVGQALIRAVAAGADELPTWRAMGADRSIATRAMVAPATLTAFVASMTALVAAIALSPRFPIAVARRYDLDLGVHFDWTVLGTAAVLTAFGIAAAAWVTAVVRASRAERVSGNAGATWTTKVDLPPALLIGSQLAIEPGRGRRAVPVRSALVGAFAGVLGFVGCLTFRAGLVQTVSNPTRAGVVWDQSVASEGAMATADRDAIARDPAVRDAMEAQWARAIDIDGQSTPTFGTSVLRGAMQFVVLSGRAPNTSDEIAFAPATLRRLHVHIGDTVRAGPSRTSMRVVGVALVSNTSHSDYDESAWMLLDALRPMLPSPSIVGPDFVEDYVLTRWGPHADVDAARKRMSGIGGGRYFSSPAELPAAVASLGPQRSLPLALAVFFALLGSTTVAHALVTTVRRRSRELAILRSLGFTRRDTRNAVAWQATLLAVVALLLGVPAGILVGRAVWKQLADGFPVVYVPPIALVAVLLVVPVAIAIVNLIAAAPAHAATRARPAEVLRTE